ncbi:MAG: hypothetical protein GEU86_17835 [Actinophytocola sp.]|nr:hypothetical protein [Actinophytocola sp.]
MSIGRVTFISHTPGTTGSLSWRATCAIAEADFVISTGEVVSPEVLRHVPDHADVFLDGAGTTHSLMPFYDLASRDGFRIAHISSGIPDQSEEMAERLDRCAELGLTTEIIRP